MTTLSIVNNTFIDIDQVAGFEGPEKRLEIDFRVNDLNPTGLRSFDRASWQEVLNFAKCTIISQTSNEFFDSYVLSESSLFVYPYKIMIKTCGTTTLLKTVPEFIKLAESCGTKPEFLLYTRKNFNFPTKQVYPHTSFEAETEFLNQFFSGQSHVLGPVSGDHWYMYVADLTGGALATKPDHTLEIMMSDLDRNVMGKFYRGELDAKQTTSATGIDQLLPGSTSDEVLFTPCGYSVNGLKQEAYYTIHITPEPHCSFVSFETNVTLANYNKLIRHVLEIFNPATFCFSMFRDTVVVPDADPRRVFDVEIPGYQCLSHNSQSYGDNFHVSFCTYKATPSD